MLDLFFVEGARWCISRGEKGESLYVFGEFLIVGYEVWPLSLGLGSLVSGTDDVP